MSEPPGSLPVEGDEGTEAGEARKWPYVVATSVFVALGALGAVAFFALRDGGEVATTATSSTTAGNNPAGDPEPTPDSEWIYPWTSQAQLDRVISGSSPGYCDPATVAADFVQEVIGYREPQLGSPTGTEEGTTEVALSARGEGGVVTDQVTTIVLDDIAVEGADCKPFVVVGALTEDVTIDSAAYEPGLDAVKVQGEGRAFEGTIEARLVSLDEGGAYQLVASEFTTAGSGGSESSDSSDGSDSTAGSGGSGGSNSDVQPFSPVEIPVEVAVDVGLVVANPQVSADGAEPPFTVERVDIGSDGTPGDAGEADSPPDTSGDAPPDDTVAAPPDAPVSGLPAQANAALGTPVWGLYIAVVEEAYAGYNAPELTEAVLDAYNLGYNTNARNLSCDDDAVGALGYDPLVSWLTVPLYFNSEADARAVADRLYSYVGIAKVTVGCLG